MISFDTKRFLRKKKFWIAFASVLFIAALLSINLNKEKKYDYRNLQTTMLNYKDQVNYNLNNLFEEDNDYVRALRSLADEFENNVNKQDWHKVNANLCDMNIMEAQRISAIYGLRNKELYLHDYVVHKDQVDQLVNERGLPEITTEMLRDDYRTTIMSNDETPAYPFYQYQAQFYHELDRLNIDRFNYATVDSSTVMMHFIRTLFPLLPIMITLFMCYDGLQEDKDSGVIKVILTQPLQRSRYIRKKIGLHMKAVLCVFFIPILFLSLCYGIQDHYQTLSAPVLANVQGITSMDMMENTLPRIQQEDGNIGTIGITKYFSIPYRFYSPNTEFTFMELWQFVGLCLLMCVLVLIFIILINTFINLIVPHKITSLVISLVILLAGMFFCGADTIDRIYGFFPFTFFNPVQILSGYSTFTYLNGIVVLGISNLVLYILILLVFKKKDVIC